METDANKDGAQLEMQQKYSAYLECVRPGAHLQLCKEETDTT